MSHPILDNDLTDVNPKYPILPSGAYQFKMGLAMEKTKDQTGDIVRVTLTLAQQTTDREGKPVFPGHVITDRISLQPTEKYPIDNIKKRLKQVMIAALGESNAKGKFDIDLLQGKEVTVKLKVEQDATGEYDDSNRVARYVPRD